MQKERKETERKRKGKGERNALNMGVWPVLGLFAVLTVIVTADTFARVVCRIVSSESVCYEYEDGGKLISQCGLAEPCRVWTGMELQISCGEEDGDISLNLFHDNSTLGGREISWPFATASEVEGLYQCRRYEDGSLFASRYVLVNETVFVIPAGPSYEQSCRRDIVPHYDCSVARDSQRFSADYRGRHTVLFNVLGVRPIDVMIEVIWVNHYPVDLHLSWNMEASNLTTLQSVELSTDDLRFIGGVDIVEAYIVISATGSSHSSTLCVPVSIHGVSTLFPNESLPRDLTVSEGQAANFSCDVQTTLYQGLSHTVAFLARSPESHKLMHCLNCSFSTTRLVYCQKMTDGGSCLGLQFFNSSFGNPNLVIHHLTAHWSHVDTNHTGYEVACAVAALGVTQWVHSATLTLLTPTVTPTTTQDSNLTQREVVLLTSGIVVLVGSGLASLAFLLVCCLRYRYLQKTRCVHAVLHGSSEILMDKIDSD